MPSTYDRRREAKSTKRAIGIFAGLIFLYLILDLWPAGQAPESIWHREGPPVLQQGDAFAGIASQKNEEIFFNLTWNFAPFWILLFGYY